MTKYISKSALIAEIEKRIDAALTRQHNLKAIGQETVLNEMLANELNRIISFLDTLEVKEVDLDKEITDYLEEFIADPTKSYFRQAMLHFFELGLKARKGEEV